MFFGGEDMKKGELELKLAKKTKKHPRDGGGELTAIEDKRNDLRRKKFKSCIRCYY